MIEVGEGSSYKRLAPEGGGDKAYLKRRLDIEKRRWSLSIKYQLRMTSVSFPRYKQFYSELNTKQLFQPVIRELPANQAPRFFRDDPETEKTLFTSFQGTPSSRFSFQLTFTFNDPRTILSLLLGHGPYFCRVVTPKT